MPHNFKRVVSGLNLATEKEKNTVLYRNIVQQLPVNMLFLKYLNIYSIPLYLGITVNYG